MTSGYGPALRQLAHTVLQGPRRKSVDLNGQRTFHLRRVPDILRPLRRDLTRTLWLNRRYFKQDIRYIVDNFAVDAVITGPSCFMLGHPPFDLSIPLIFDYLDCADWEKSIEWKHAEQEYLRGASAVLCVSQDAYARATEHNERCLLLPNGADVDRFRAAHGYQVRDRYKFGAAKIVSLIGLTCSPRFYFLEAVQIAKRSVPELKCLLVGHSPALERALAEIPDAGATFVLTGPVPHEDIASHFAASDVGMYPVDTEFYYQAASPIKLFEYTAAGKPIVLPRLREAERLGFPNLVFADPSPEAFAEGIIAALRAKPQNAKNMELHDWKRRAADLENFLHCLLE